MIEKLRDNFDNMLVYKDLQKSNFFSSISLPSFIRDWILKKYADDEGNVDYESIKNFIDEYLPKRKDWLKIKDRIINDYDYVKCFTKIVIDIDIKTQAITFSLPDLGLKNKDTIITPKVWQNIKDELNSGNEVWGLIELGYRVMPENNKDIGKIELRKFSNFCPYTVNLEHYKDARNDFTTEEWIDILLGAIDYNATGYQNELEKLTMISRLLPFVEKRINLIELAPKGTGKSYLFGNISKYGWLSSGGLITRAKMFYAMSGQKLGFVNFNDFVAFDEIQTIKFNDNEEMRSALKGYLENGQYTVGNFKGVADAGLILLGNIDYKNMNTSKYMFGELPSSFDESALFDRFHGFIKGWIIPRMNDGLKMSGWALNTEYFCSILHLLRDDISYRTIVDQLIDVPIKSDTRDTEAVKRIATGLLKLIFPNVIDVNDISKDDFNNYCFLPAFEMRKIIRYQLHIKDNEYRTEMPELKVKDL